MSKDWTKRMRISMAGRCPFTKRKEKKRKMNSREGLRGRRSCSLSSETTTGGQSDRHLFHFWVIVIYRQAIVSFLSQSSSICSSNPRLFFFQTTISFILGQQSGFFSGHRQLYLEHRQFSSGHRHRIVGALGGGGANTHARTHTHIHTHTHTQRFDPFTALIAGRTQLALCQSSSLNSGHCHGTFCRIKPAISCCLS